MLEMTTRILIINPFGVGDVLFSTPLVSALKRKYPRCYIGYICNIRTKEILATNPSIDKVFVFERDEYRVLWRTSKIEAIKKYYNFWLDIRKKRFEVVVDLSLGKEYAFLCWLASIKERRGFNYKGRGRFLTDKIEFDGFNNKPVAEYYLDLALPTQRRNGGARCESESKEISMVLIPDEKDKTYIDDFLKGAGIEDGDFFVGIAPGGGISFGNKDQDKRRWGTTKFSQLADRIVETFNVKIILIWGPGEEELTREINTLMKQKPLIAPSTTIRQMAALCKRCKIVICSEGGPLHIASSQGVKTLSIFGPVDEKVYGPYPPGKNNTVITSDADCRPCYKHFKLSKCDTKKCLEDISVDEAFKEITSLCS